MVLEQLSGPRFCHSERSEESRMLGIVPGQHPRFFTVFRMTRRSWVAFPEFVPDFTSTLVNVALLTCA